LVELILIFFEVTNINTIFHSPAIILVKIDIFGERLVFVGERQDLECKCILNWLVVMFVF